MIYGEVDGGDAPSLVAVGNAGAGVADVAQSAVVVSNDGACEGGSRKIRLNRGVCTVT